MKLDDLALAVQKRLGGTVGIERCRILSKAVLEAIAEGIQSDGKVKLQRFGVFDILERRYSVSSELVRTVRFKPSEFLKRKVNPR